MRHHSRLTEDYGKSELQRIRKCPGWENKIEWKGGIRVSTNKFTLHYGNLILFLFNK